MAIQTKGYFPLLKLIRHKEVLEESMSLFIYRLESLASQGKTKWNLQVSVYRRGYSKPWKYTNSTMHRIAIKYQH